MRVETFREKWVGFESRAKVASTTSADLARVLDRTLGSLLTHNTKLMGYFVIGRREMGVDIISCLMTVASPPFWLPELPKPNIILAG